MKGYKARPRLTLKTARELALKVTGTAKGLAKDKALRGNLNNQNPGEAVVQRLRDMYRRGIR